MVGTLLTPRAARGRLSVVLRRPGQADCISETITSCEVTCTGTGAGRSKRMTGIREVPPVLRALAAPVPSAGRVVHRRAAHTRKMIAAPGRDIKPRRGIRTSDGPA